MHQNVEKVSNGLLTLLESKGGVYVVAAPEVHVSLGQPHLFAANYITNYRWSPLPFKTVEEQGETQSVDDEAFARYMSLVKRWDSYFGLPEKRHLEGITRRYGRDFYVGLVQESIAHNRYGKPIACRFQYQVYHQVVIERDWLERPQKVERKLMLESGPMLLLPLPTEVDDREAINVSLEDFSGRPQRTKPPEWAEAIQMPGVAQLDIDIEKKQEEIEHIVIGIHEREKQREEIVRYKQLLFVIYIYIFIFAFIA